MAANLQQVRQVVATKSRGLATSIMKLNKQKAVLTQNLARMAQAEEALRSQVTRLESANSADTQRVQMLESELESTRSQMESGTQALQNLQAELQQKIKAFEQAQQQLDQMQVQLQQTSADLDQCNMDYQTSVLLQLGYDNVLEMLASEIMYNCSSGTCEMVQGDFAQYAASAVQQGQSDVLATHIQNIIMAEFAKVCEEWGWDFRQQSDLYRNCMEITRTILVPFYGQQLAEYGGIQV